MILIQPFKSAEDKVEKLYEDFPFDHEELDLKKDIKESYSEKRDQYDAYEYLSSCDKTGKKNDKIVLGITDKDLFVPKLNFVFGLAQKNGYGCIISTNRLGEGGLLKERILKEAVHEIGHVVGLEHCLNNNCVMYFSNSLSDTDRKTGWFCDVCFDKFKKREKKRKEKIL
ncbi:MAG: archaemetzincin family Zn-dependent metalloprotease [Thermoplasmatota archaeon]